MTPEDDTRLEAETYKAQLERLRNAANELGIDTTDRSLVTAVIDEIKQLRARPLTVIAKDVTVEFVPRDGANPYTIQPRTISFTGKDVHPAAIAEITAPTEPEAVPAEVRRLRTQLAAATKHLERLRPPAEEVTRTKRAVLFGYAGPDDLNKAVSALCDTIEQIDNEQMEAVLRTLEATRTEK